MNQDVSSSDDDEWAIEDIPLPMQVKKVADIVDDNINHVDGDGGDKYWQPDSELQIPNVRTPAENTLQEDVFGDPMIIVDLTTMSHSRIHNKFDRNAVNDPVAASNLRQTIERDYQKYANNATLLSMGTVIPCGTTVWRMALVHLRVERPGHYFVPIFPSRKP